MKRIKINNGGGAEDICFGTAEPEFGAAVLTLGGKRKTKTHGGIVV